MPQDVVEGTLEGFAAILARLEALRGQPHVSDAYVEFRIELLEAQRAVRRALVAAATGRPTSRGPQADPTGAPLTPDTVVFDGELLRELLAATCVAAANHGRETEDLRRIADAAAAEPGFLRTLAQAAAFGPDQRALEALARRWGIYTDALLFVGRATAAPDGQRRKVPRRPSSPRRPPRGWGMGSRPRRGSSRIAVPPADLPPALHGCGGPMAGAS